MAKVVAILSKKDIQVMVGILREASKRGNTPRDCVMGEAREKARLDPDVSESIKNACPRAWRTLLSLLSYPDADMVAKYLDGLESMITFDDSTVRLKADKETRYEPSKGIGYET